jgi:hypothetical protein
MEYVVVAASSSVVRIQTRNLKITKGLDLRALRPKSVDYIIPEAPSLSHVAHCRALGLKTLRLGHWITHFPWLLLSSAEFSALLAPLSL